MMLVSSVLGGAIAGVIGGLAADSGWKFPAAMLGAAVGGVVGILFESSAKRRRQQAVAAALPIASDAPPAKPSTTDREPRA